MTHSPRGVRRRRAADSPDTLVAVLNSDGDRHFFLKEHAYRIPDRVLGRALARDALEGLKYLALYQSSGITEGLPGAIEWWGKVARIESLRRHEIIPDEPDHRSAGELYHLITVGRPRRLNPPLRSRHPRRITFIRTTRKRLIGAEDIGDLPLGSPGAESLIEAVSAHVAEQEGRGVDLGRRTFMKVRDVGMEVDFGLYEGDAGLGVICDDRVAEEGPVIEHSGRVGIIRFSAARVETDVESCVDQIMAALARLHTPPDTGEP